jgi:hypothetical protein
MEEADTQCPICLDDEPLVAAVPIKTEDGDGIVVTYDLNGEACSETESSAVVPEPPHAPVSSSSTQQNLVTRPSPKRRRSSRKRSHLESNEQAAPATICSSSVLTTSRSVERVEQLGLVAREESSRPRRQPRIPLEAKIEQPPAAAAAAPASSSKRNHRLEDAKHHRLPAAPVTTTSNPSEPPTTPTRVPRPSPLLLLAEGEELWRSIANRARNVYRIRQMRRHSMCPADPMGAAPSEWVVEKGCIISSSRVLPPDIETPKQAREYLKRDVQDIVTKCRELPGWADSIRQATRYCNGYKCFGLMKKGGIVALHVAYGPRKGVFYFGVIQAKKIYIKSFNELADKEFPSPHVFEGDRWTRGNVMLRKVRWLRKALARDLPSQTRGKTGAEHVKWLLESGPSFWLSDVTKYGGVDVMRNDAFLESTTAII